MSDHLSYEAEGSQEYARLAEYAAKRSEELASMLQPYIEATDKYGRLISRLCLILGDLEPKSVQDSVVRDLTADVADFLLESRPFLLRGNTLLAFPLARRAYESMSLLHLCVADSSVAERWAQGKQIGNHEVRKALGQHPMGEPEERLRALYKFFCEMTHPNRDMIAFRGLGEGNRFVLGSIGRPELVVLADFCLKHLELWFWLCPTAAYFYREHVFSRDSTFQNAHTEAREFAQSVARWLGEQYNKLLAEYRGDSGRVAPKFSEV